MALQRNPIAGGVDSYKPNTLWSNGFAIATSSKAQSQDTLTYYAGETGGSQYIIYSTKDAQSEAYPSGSADYTPVAWGSFDSLNPTKLLELINGLPGRPAGTQYATAAEAMNWLTNSAEYFVMNQDYPFVHLDNPLVIWDPSIPQCSGLGLLSGKTTKNIGNNQLTSFPGSFLPGNPNMIDFGTQGSTAYGTFQTNTNNDDAAMTSENPFSIGAAYSAVSPNGFTLSIWFKHSAISSISSPCPLIEIGNSTSTGLIIAIDADWVYYGQAATIGAVNKESHSFSNNQWNNVTLVYNSDNISNELALWINGSSMNTGSDGNFNKVQSVFVKIGGSFPSIGILLADPNLQIGNLIIDSIDSASFINYNYLAYKAANGINGKY